MDSQTLSSGRSVEVPKAVQKQLELCRKYQYKYRLNENGGVENNSTLYVATGVAHAYQIEDLFKEAIEKAKSQPEIFGQDFECDVKVNLVRRQNGEHMLHAFVDVTNPSLYYALIGRNIDGSERVQYIDNPNWKSSDLLATSKPNEKKQIEPKVFGKSWADFDDDDNNSEIIKDPGKPLETKPTIPKIRKELPPLLTLSPYPYDEQQKEYLKTQETHGKVLVFPAFIRLDDEEEEDLDQTSLYVTNVPAFDYEFLYEIFARYARWSNKLSNLNEADSSNRKSSKGQKAHSVYPIISIKQNSKGIYAIVKYSHPYDAKFALQMLQKIRAKYNGQDILISVRQALKRRNFPGKNKNKD